MNLRPIIILLTGCCLSTCLHAQDSLPSTDNVLRFPSSFFNKVNQKTAALDKRLTQQAAKYLRLLVRCEQKLKRRLRRKNSTLAKNLFDDAPGRYQEYNNKLQKKSFHIDPRKTGYYLPHADSLKMLLSFVQRRNLNLADMKGAAGALQSMQTIQDKLKYVQDVRKYIKNRRNFLTEQISSHGLSAHLKRINKDVYYYYGQYIQGYKNIMSEPSKLEKTSVEVVSKVPAFKEFAENNSVLSSLFGAADINFISAGGVNAIPTSGLQTRTEIALVVNTGIISAGQPDQGLLGERLSSVKYELKRIQSTDSQWDDDVEMPNFKSNEMRTKSILQRLQFGTNLQFDKSNSLISSSADIAGQVVYKYHQNGSAGFGALYKLGFGSLRPVSFSHQGLALRSFWDYTLKCSYFVNCGIEYNYNAAFRSIEELRSLRLGKVALWRG